MSASTLDREKGRIFSYDVLEYGLNYRIDEIRSAIGIKRLKNLLSNIKKDVNLF